MSGSEHASADADDDRVAVTAGGVHVSKWLAETGSTVPIVKYEIRSMRDEDVRVALTDRVPEHIDLDDVGFHDEYRGEHWQHAGAHALRFETELTAGETISTVYGVRREAIDDPETFLTRPELSISSSATGGDDTDAEATDAGEDEDAAVVADAEATSTLSLADPTGDAGDGEESSETEAEPKAGDAGEVWADAAPSILETPSTDDDAAALAADDVERPVDGDGGVGSDATGEGDGAIVERLVAALRSDAVGEETRAALGRELNLELSASTSQFVDHLQSRAKEKRGRLESDLESLEDSVAELYGTKADASTVATLDTRKADEEAVDALAADVTALTEEKAGVDDLEQVRDALETLDDAAAMESDVAAAEESFAEEVAALEAELESLEASAATADALEDLAENVESLDRRTPALDAFESLRADHDELASTVDDVEAALASETDALAEDLDAEADALRSEVDDLETLLSERLDRERAEVDDELASKADASTLSATTERVDELADAKADADRVAAVESTLEAEYVTERDITDAIEARMRRSLLSRTLLVAGGAAAGGGTALVATGVTAGGVLVVAGLVAFAAWYRLHRRELAPQPSDDDAAAGTDVDAAEALDAGDEDPEPPELAAADDVDPADHVTDGEAVEDEETGAGDDD